MVGGIEEAGTWPKVHDVFTHACRVDIGNNCMALAGQIGGRWCGKPVKKVGLHEVPVNLVNW